MQIYSLSLTGISILQTNSSFLVRPEFLVEVEAVVRVP